jgi:exopolysaccharide biosynthesis polyprenyl glycosylphosphotransferase
LEANILKAARRILVILDALSLVIAMIAAMTIHSLLRQHFAGFQAPPAIDLYLLLAYLTLPLWLALATVLGLYRQIERPLAPAALFRDLLQLHVFGLLALSLLIYLTQILLNRSVVALFVVLTFALMYANRMLFHAWLSREHRLGHGQRRILLVTDSRRTVAFVADRFDAQPFPPKLIGCLVPAGAGGETFEWGIPVLGGPEAIRSVLHHNAVDLVLVSCSRDVMVDVDLLLDACEEVGVLLQCHVRADTSGNRAVRVVDDIGLPSIVFETNPRSTEGLIAKRAIDLILSLLALIVLLPVIGLIATAILLTMGRPILLQQQRMGYNGRTFTMYKFRTMVRDADQLKAELGALNEMDGPAFKIHRDPRVTPVGRVLRRASLDELPQLFNVLLGRMSLVGPRPLVVGEQQRISGPQRRRLSMKPGMTGLWQVSGRSNLSFEEWMRLDLQYVDNWTLGLDLKLLARTIPAVLSGRGAV